MFSDKEVLLKSLHVCLKLPIVVFNSEFSIIKEYRSDRTTYFFYDYKKLRLRPYNCVKVKHQKSH